MDLDGYGAVKSLVGRRDIPIIQTVLDFGEDIVARKRHVGFLRSDERFASLHEVLGCSQQCKKSEGCTHKRTVVVGEKFLMLS